MSHSSSKKICWTNEFQTDLGELYDQIGSELTVGAMLEGVKYQLEKNSHSCPKYKDTNLKYYVPRQIRNLPRIKILFIEDADTIKLCALVIEDD